jgi:hypothetical protein
MAPIPHPITASGAASSPKAMTPSAARAAGMTRTLHTGMAMRLARMAKCCVLWKW